MSDSEIYEYYESDEDAEDQELRERVEETIDSLDENIINMQTFLQSGNYSRSSNNDKFNITDRTKGSYLIPENKISSFMHKLHKCINNENLCMFSESQLSHSGIMLDFDILQKSPQSHIMDDNFINGLIGNIFGMMCELIEMEDYLADNGSVHFVILKRPDVTFNTKLQAHKDGMHILIPSVKITRPLKKLLIEKLQEKAIPTYFSKLPLSEGLDPKDVLDKNSAHVPIFFYKNVADRKKKKPYFLHRVIRCQKNWGAFSFVNETNIFLEEKRKNFLCWEFSINWEARYNSTTPGLIKKQNFEVKRHHEAALEKYYVAAVVSDSGSNDLDLLFNTDPDAKIIDELLHILHENRAASYNEWWRCLRILAKTSISYKILARRFSMRCPAKYKESEFEKYWDTALQQRATCNYTISTIYHYANTDNSVEYQKIISDSVFAIIKNNIQNIILEGKLQNFNIAKILSYVFKGRFKYASPTGRLAYWYQFVLPGDKFSKYDQVYKWKKWDKAYECPPLEKYMSETLFSSIEKQARYFKEELAKMRKDEVKNPQSKIHRYELLLKNIKESGRKLLETRFKSDVLGQAQSLFIDSEFANKLDQSPETHNILGVANGILKLGEKTEFITNFHPYPISRYTPIDYVPYDPSDPLTKEVYVTLRSMFTDDESDSFEYLMYYLAAALDFKVKDALFMIIIGGGGNGKTTLMNMITQILGLVGDNGYAAKLPAQVWLTAMKGGDSPSPSLADLQFARFAFSSEFEENVRLLLSVMKELTGGEYIRVRRLHENGSIFMVKCLFALLSNYEFEIEGNDDGTWRRIKNILLKMKFVTADKFTGEKFQRLANPNIQKEWSRDPQVLSRFLSILVYFYENLQKKYQGNMNKVPHPHIKYDTENFRNKQDKINNFITRKIIRTPDESDEIQFHEITGSYCGWHHQNFNRIADRRGLEDKFLNSKIAKFFKKTKMGVVITNHKIIDENYILREGEKRYSIEGILKREQFTSETPEEYYERKCREFENS